jgi:serine protease Do
MKKVYIVIFLVFIFLVGCAPQDKLEMGISNKAINLKIGDTYPIALKIDGYPVEWTIQNEEVIKINGTFVFAIENGQSLLTAKYNAKEFVYIFKVYSDINNVIISGVNNLKVGETSLFSAEVYPIAPIAHSQNVIWKSIDEEIATVDSDGLVTGTGFGFTRIRAISKLNDQIYNDYNILVRDPKIDNPYNDLFEIIDQNEKIDLSEFGFLHVPINKVINAVVGVSSNNNGIETALGSGLIYKSELTSDEDNANGKYKYYVVTNDHIINNGTKISIFYGKDEELIVAELISSDAKTDLAVLSFTSSRYFSTAEIIDQVPQVGEIVLTIGHPQSYDYYQSVTSGIVSNSGRYISVDTNNDNINDWDSIFIQHDAPISPGNSGGPLINLNGQVIGINSKKIVGSGIEGMSFAIPGEEIIKIVSILEKGLTISRATLGVSVLSIKQILDSPSYYKFHYGIDLSEFNYNYGFYISEVNQGIAREAGVIAGDIILKFNNVEMRYIHMFRAAIANLIIGSGDIIPIVVVRNGVEMILYIEC